jgi:hypothetical protein
MRSPGLALLAASSLAAITVTSASAVAAPQALSIPPGVTGWQRTGLGGIRGITVGPIESGLHPGKGYGSPPCARTMSEVQRMGGNWVSLTPFGRVADLSPSGIDRTFEAPFARNKSAVATAIAQAHAAGLRALVVPHLWMESSYKGDWRGEIDPGDDAEWERWAASYRTFLLEWARVAEAASADMLAVGVELRSWVTSTRAPAFAAIIDDVRRVYSGPLTYAANWDDVEDTVIWGSLDVIGVNAFFQLSETPNASSDVLREGGKAVADKMRAVASTWQKPIVFTELGYTTIADPAYKPWIWPEAMGKVVPDLAAQAAQDRAYTALLAPLFDESWFAGLFVWRFYADPDDMSQEAEWGFSPRGKLAELAVRDAFAAQWSADGARAPGTALVRQKATRIALY